MHTLFLSLFTFGILFMSVVSSSAESAPPKFALGVGLEFSSGTFGTGSTSTYATAPVIFDWFPTDRIDLELTVPFIYQRTSNTGHAVLSTSMPSTATVAKKADRGSMSGTGGGSGSMFGGEYGLGDITLTSGYTLLKDSEKSLNLRPTIYVKFPTADESNGSGTGKFDFGAGVAVSKWLGNWQPFAEGRFVVQGAAHDETGAENFVTADTGVSYSWNANLSTSGFARYGSKLFDSMAAPLEARVKVEWRFSERAYTDVYALKGFSDGSPDYGGGASVFVEF
jgi:hypothetical protein